MRTFNIPFSFVSSPETEKDRLLYTLESIANGFYPRHGYLILPKPAKGYERYTIVIPEVVKGLSDKFWDDATKYGNRMPKIITKRMRKETDKIILPPVSKDSLIEFEKEWTKIKDKTLSAIYKYFPTELKWISSVEVRITKIGSGSAHYLLDKKRGQHLSLAIREDMNVEQIVNLLVLSLIYPLNNDLFLSFTHRQTVRNFILSRQEFKKITNLKPEIFDNPKIPLSFKRASEDYIKFLGIPNIINPINVIQDNIDLFGAKESKLLNHLINNQGQIISYDTIADLIWGEGRFKSYWAINKIVQRIKNKIKFLKVNINITGIRGIGYVIKSI